MKARELWGGNAVVHTVVTHLVGNREGAEGQIELIRMVGVLAQGELHEYGTGATWESAFIDAGAREKYIRELAKKRTK